MQTLITTRHASAAWWAWEPVAGSVAAGAAEMGRGYTTGHPLLTPGSYRTGAQGWESTGSYRTWAMQVGHQQAATAPG